MFEVGGLALGILGGIGKIFGRGKANKQLAALQRQNPAYKENPLAKQRLGLAQQLLNARAPGAAGVERNIYNNQANQVANINKAATDSSQALAMASGTQGVTNEAFNQLGQSEAQDYQRRQGNLDNAQQGVINEQDKVFQDQIRRFQDMAQIRGAQNANRQANWGDVSNLGMGLFNYGANGGMSGLFGKGKNSSSSVVPQFDVNALGSNGWGA